MTNAFHTQFCGCWSGTNTRVERQTTTSSHVRGRYPWETYSFTSFSASVSSLNHQIFTYFFQRRSFLSFCYHLNLKQAFKGKNLVPMTIHHFRCRWSRALHQVLVRMLMQKRPLLLVPYFESTNSSLLRKCALWNFDVKRLPFTSVAEILYNYWKTLFVGL